MLGKLVKLAAVNIVIISFCPNKFKQNGMNIIKTKVNYQEMGMFHKIISQITPTIIMVRQRCRHFLTDNHQ